MLTKENESEKLKADHAAAIHSLGSVTDLILTYYFSSKLPKLPPLMNSLMTRMHI